MVLRALYVDFNSYFASVEQQFRPELRGRPVAVLPVMADTTCCIAASYEAKAYGIRTGTAVHEARRLCPDLVLIEARPELYIRTHHRLVEAVESCVHVQQVRSIDEMWCRLGGRDSTPDNARILARHIKETIANSVGECLRSSIGIGPNRFLAKLASNMQKPDGLTVIEQHELPQRLYGLKLRQLSGIGHSMEARLNAVGIDTVEQLCAAHADVLAQAWRGITGRHMHRWLRGEDIVDRETERSSVSHSHVLPPLSRDARSAHAILNRLLQKAARRMRSMGYVTSLLHVGIKFVDRRRWGMDAVLDPTSDTLTLLQAFEQLWRSYPRKAAAPLAIGVSLLDLAPANSRSLSLFGPGERRDKLDAALDRLNQRYGEHTLYFGGAHEVLGEAPLRIAFNHIPVID